MRFVRFGLAVVGSIALVVACVGGPGPVDQGSDDGDQYGGIQNEGRTQTSSGNTKKTTPTTNSSGTATTSTSGAPDTPPRPPVVVPDAAKPPPPDLVATDYSQSCQKDTDCRSIFQGPACNVCKCDNAAISSTDFNRYSQDRVKRQLDCPPSPGGGACAPCPTQGQAHCDASKRCVVGPGTGDAG